MNLRRRPRWWVLAPVMVVVLVSVCLLFVPVTAVYVTSKDDPAPHDMATRYSWWTSEQNFVYSDTGTGRDVHLVNGIRLDCANVLSTGSHELAAPSGPQACASVETPRLVGALVLFTLGLVGLLLAARMPARSGRGGDRYRMPRSQRRALKRGR